MTSHLKIMMRNLQIMTKMEDLRHIMTKNQKIQDTDLDLDLDLVLDLDLEGDEEDTPEDSIG